MSRNLFITGTGTDIGKTFVSGLILKELHEDGARAAWFKAAASGNPKDENGMLLPGDALKVKEISGIEEPLEDMCPYLYERAVSPHLAARIEGKSVDREVVRAAFDTLTEKYDYVTMEGSGGIACPLSFDAQEIWLEDMIKELDLPCVITADAGLGTINAVVLTAEYMKARDIEVKGIIFNRFHPGNIMEEDNAFMCEHRTGLKVLAFVKEGEKALNMDVNVLKSLYN